MPFTIVLGDASVTWLHTSGTYIYDAAGRQIRLNGINFQYSQGESLSLSDLQTGKALGFNVFRVNNVYWGLLQPYNESTKGIDSQYFATGKSPGHTSMVPLDTVVNMAVQLNMYVIICMQTWSGWYVPPAWAFPSISHAGNNAVWGHESTTTQQAYAALINGTAVKERTGIINTWQFIANRYKAIPNVMFELVNEPIVSTNSLVGSYYKSFNEAMISAIESVETQSHLKIIELLRDRTDNEIIPGALDVGKSNVVWANHLYAPVPYYPTGSYWHDAFTWHGRYLPAGWGNGTTYVAWRLIRVASLIHGWNRPWMNTEFSKLVSEPHWVDWLGTVMSTMVEQSVTGWYYFCYSSDPTKYLGWNIRESTTQQLVFPILKPYLTTQISTTTTASATSTTVKSTSTTTTMTTSVTTRSATTSTSLTSTSRTVTTTQGPLGPSTVGPSTDSRASGSPYQGKSCFQSGLFWVWYTDGGNMAFRTSVDGVNWRGSTVVRAVNSGLYFGIYCDGTFIHYAFGNNAANGALFYRRGLTRSDGTITWSTAEQTVVGAQPCCANTKPSVTVDSNGDPWIAYQWVNFTAGTTYVPKIIKSITNDGTWNTANGFPYSLLPRSSTVQLAGVVALSGGKVGALATKDGGAKVNLRTWNGRGWNPTVSTANNIGDSRYWSAVNQGDDIHLVYLRAGSTGSVTYVRYVYSTNMFGSETVLQTSTSTDAAPTISIDLNKNNLFCSWAGFPDRNHVYYREYQASNSTWLARTDWLTELGLIGNDRLTMFSRASNNYVGLVYMNKTTGPYQIRFARLNIAGPLPSLATCACPGSDERTKPK
jgi:hypothetical protein